MKNKNRFNPPEFDLDNVVAMFERRCGYSPDIENPTTFNEKILYRKIHDRRQVLVDMTDKITARQIAESKCPDVDIIPYVVANEHYQPPLYPVVVKPTNKSGQTFVVHSRAEYQQAYHRLMRLKDKYYGLEKGEWPYSQVPFKIIVEPAISYFTELHFYCFGGLVPMFIVVEEYRSLPNRPTSRGPGSFTLFDRYGQKIEAGIEGRPTSPVPDLPLKRLVDMAESLSAGMDFVRVDLMHTHNRTYFAEYTFYPASGCYKWQPREFDTILGGFWNAKI